MPSAKVNGISMYYEVHGNGEPMVLIHGSSYDVSAWAGQLGAFSKKYKVLLFDNRGTGRTEATKPPYDTAMMADDTAALMDHTGMESAHVLGYSLGGYIAQELALRHPGKVRSLILAATGANYYPIGKARTELLLRMVREGVSFELVLRTLFLWMFSNRFFEDDSRVSGAIEAFAKNPYPQPINGLEGQIAALLNHDASGRVGRISSRTLIVCGEDDIAVPARLSKQMAGCLRDSMFVMLKGAAHSFPFEMPEEFNRTVLEFLDDKLR